MESRRALTSFGALDLAIVSLNVGKQLLRIVRPREERIQQANESNAKRKFGAVARAEV